MLCLSLLVVCAITFLSYRSIEAAGKVKEQYSISLRLIDLNRDLLSMLKDAQTGQRGFIVTGREQYLDPYNDAIRAIPRLMEEFKAQAAARLDQLENIQNLEPLVAAKLDVLEEAIELRRFNKEVELQKILDADRGKILMDEIRVRSAAIEDLSKSRLAAFAVAEDKSSSQLRLVSISGGVLLFIFLLISTVVIFRSMRRREELYQEADAARKLLAATLEGITDAVIATDQGGKITFINPVAGSLAGWNEGEAVGSDIGKIFSVVDATTQVKADNPIEKALTEGMAVGLTEHTNLVSKDGRQIPIDDSAAPLKDKQGKVVGGVLVFRDISARREAKQQLDAALAALERTNEDLQQFINAAAHDLKSPLNYVGGMAELLSRKLTDKLDDQCKELLGFINKGVAHMAQLLEDLLSFAQASHFDRSAGSLPLNGALDTALINLSTEVSKTEATVTSDPLPVIEAHETHMILLLQNLVGNALKYRGQSPPRVHVSAKRENTEWIISVTDNGIGIDPAQAEEVFKPFKRLHSEEYPGTGIGLASCQKIVAGYGGRIWVAAAQGSGFRFCFTLPVTGK